MPSQKLETVVVIDPEAPNDNPKTHTMATTAAEQKIKKTLLITKFLLLGLIVGAFITPIRIPLTNHYSSTTYDQRGPTQLLRSTRLHPTFAVMDCLMKIRNTTNDCEMEITLYEVLRATKNTTHNPFANMFVKNPINGIDSKKN